MQTNTRLAAAALMLGNLVTGIAILGPAGMLSELASGLSVTIRDAGLLMTFGAILLCLMSPLMVWLTSTFDRRRLLVATAAVLAAGHIASALAPDYASLLAVRLLMLTLAAAYTPVAAGTIAQIVSERARPGYISFVFMGWSVAVAAGLPLVTFAAAHIGWRETFAGLGVAGAVIALLLMVSLPAGLRSAPISLRSWSTIAQRPLILVLLLITVLWTGGQFSVFTYLGPLIARLGGGGTEAIGACFAAMGIMGFVGNIAATAIVNRLGAYRTSAIFLSALLAGAAFFAFAAGSLVLMFVGCAIWGLGFAAFNSMQQARLVAAAPPLASASVALNTSANYVGQAIGSAIGAELFVRGQLLAMGYVDVAFMVAAMAALIVSSRLR
jgi:predicted MFS family arabinose efflux permease